MFSSKKRKSSAKIDSLIGQNTLLCGDVEFSGGFHVDGKLKGCVRSVDPESILTLSDQGVIEGDVHVPNIILNGTVIGDVYASERVELASNAKVIGNVYYNLIEMAMGAEVNGNLVHQAEPRESTGEIVDPA
ncbi:MAG TPA: polymer-forming cytoskeletal protein [Candidatus Tenderia electrophaga]|uniref:Polymer-forming cytoskeletal protein n=1 Tax=Candidatus Tenderia electrophaga TaxID=1748243 RepID=A0A832N3F4_9GAMM|nr:polymer-forming cytoskeletal protein [Candidatus Tenderia electrophaga]